MILRILWLVLIVGVAALSLWAGWRLIDIVLDRFEMKNRRKEDENNKSKN